MGKAFSPPLSASYIEWITEQKIFFVATAPVSVLGHVNISPKSSGQFRVSKDGNYVYYLDFTGSGSETSAHLMDSQGRITVMFVSFEKSPRILRLFGSGRILTKSMLQDSLITQFNLEDVHSPGFRWIIEIRLERISTSCGYSIPFFNYEGERNTLTEVTNKLGTIGMLEYRNKKNIFSIDGLFACPEMNRIPTKVENEEGFLLCYYDQGIGKTFLHIALQRLLWYIRMKFKTKISYSISSFIFGICATLMAQRVLKKFM